MSVKAKMSRHSFSLDRPARNFNEAFPIGNGRLGAMVYGGQHLDTLSLNEDTLWSGLTAPKPKPSARGTLDTVRELIFSNQHEEAEALIQRDMLTEFNQPYLPAGELIIGWSESLPDDHYQRSLSLDNAIVSVQSGTTSSQVKRDYFVSSVDQVIAVNIQSEGQILFDLSLSLSAKLSHQLESIENEHFLNGRIPTDVLWEDIEEAHTDSYQVSYDDERSRYYSIGLTVFSTTGLVQVNGNGVTVHQAKDTVVLVTIATGTDKTQPMLQCQRQLKLAAKQTIGELKQRHVEEYQRYFQRMELCFESATSKQQHETIEARLAEFSHGGEDTKLISDLFNYARYLLISSSRPETMPANLQGIWNEQIMPPWWSNYTININTEMNYWAAESCGLGECHTALLDFITSLAKSGAETAQRQYGCRGWVAHHQTDFRRQTTPVGFRKETSFKQASKWAMWPMGGAWLSLHFYHHFQYNEDVDYLKKHGYPVIKGAAEFLCDWFINDPKNPEFLVTAPSTSPENSYLHPDGYISSVCAGSEMDMAIARSLFQAYIDISDVLANPDREFLEEVKAKLLRIPETRLTADGRIMEFGQDRPEAEHPHRHISQLFSLAPGNAICPIETPKLAQAAIKTLDFRGDTGTGWSTAWKALCWIRLEQPERAYRLLKTLMHPLRSDIFGMADEGAGLYPNMLAACPPFQIDANFGFAAAVIEMLVQDHRGIIKLLPALPEKLGNGHVRGLRLKGCMEISMAWRSGKLISARVRSNKNQKRVFLIGGKAVEFNLKKNGETNVLNFLD